MQKETFGPTQKGFNDKSPETWSKGFREQALDSYFEHDPDSFTEKHNSTNGNGLEMLLDLQAYHPRLFTRWVGEVLAKIRPETE